MRGSLPKEAESLHLKGLNVLLRLILPIASAVTTILWISVFPMRLPFDRIDFLFAGLIFSVAVALYVLMTRTSVKMLEAGWGLFTYSLLIALLNGFTKEPGLLNRVVQGILEIYGLLIVAFGMYVSQKMLRFQLAESRRTEKALEMSETKLKALHTYVRELSAAKSIDEVVDYTLGAMEFTLGFNLAEFLVVENGHLRVRGWRGAELSILELPLNGPGVTVKAANTGRAINVPDIREEPAFVDNKALALNGKRQATLSELAVPVLLNGEVVAVLNVESGRLNAFTNEDQVLLGTLAMHIGSALSRLRQLEGLERLVEERTRKLRDAERLAALGELAGMVGHDIRNPLTGIAGATYILKTRLGEKADSRAREMLDLIERNVQYSDRIINDLLDHSREIQLEWAEAELKPIVEDALTSAEIPKNVKVVNLTGKEPRMMVDPKNVKRVFVNMMKNAVEAMPEGGTLTISSKKANGNIEISFSDTGKGMTNETLEKLWMPLFTTKAKGMGFGLVTCKRIVEAHRGAILVDSTLGKGSTFTVRLPINPEPKEVKKT